jgi:hypothetical protein
MTYSSGGLIQATDYNTFAGNTTAGLNRVWSTGAGDAGWGQTDIATVATSGTVTATQWATIVNNLATSGTQTSTTLTSRTAPVTGNIIGILANVSTDITSVTTNRGNAVSSGTEYANLYRHHKQNHWYWFGASSLDYYIYTYHNIPKSANQARYFWNAGGIVRLKYGKSSTGTDADADWNTTCWLVWHNQPYWPGKRSHSKHCGAGLHWNHTPQRHRRHTNHSGNNNRLVQSHRLTHYHIPTQ